MSKFEFLLNSHNSAAVTTTVQVMYCYLKIIQVQIELL